MKLGIEGTGYDQNDFADIESHDFGIDSEDEDIVVSILRDKIYSNPIRVLCQEYICNGRDSNITAGNDYNKLDIFVPNLAIPEFRVRDNGTGLSIKDIITVFIKLGKSTKRDNEEVIGAYGLGSKSGFAYTDSFFITSWHNGFKMEAIALIAENQKGSIKFIGEPTPTDEPNGIEITVNVKEGDIQEFQDAIFRTTAFWEHQPNYLNILEHEISKKVPTVKFRNEDIVITQRCNLTDNKMILCDGVPYPFIGTPDFGMQLGSLGSYNYMFITSNKEVTPAASRENITKDKDLEAFVKSIPAKINKIGDAHLNRIKDCKSLEELEATYYDIPFDPKYSDYSLNCLPDIKFKKTKEIMVPPEYKMQYSSKGSTRWYQHAVEEFTSIDGKIIFFVNNSKSHYKNLVRRIKNNTGHRASIYYTFDEAPPIEFMNFFGVKYYEDIKPKYEKYETNDEYIQYYSLNKSNYSGSMFCTRSGSVDNIAKNGHYYAIMNAWKLKDYKYSELIAIETFVKNENKTLSLISDRQLKLLQKVEGFNWIPVSEFTISFTEANRNAILNKEYNWLPSSKKLAGIGRFKGYEILEKVALGGRSLVDVGVLKEKFPEEYEKTVKEYEWLDKYKDDPLVEEYQGLNTWTSTKDINCECLDEDEEPDYECKKCDGQGYIEVEVDTQREKFIKLVDFILTQGITVEAAKIAQ